MAQPFASARALILGVGVALGVAACGTSTMSSGMPDAASGAMCTTSPGCGTGNWCNPASMTCEPRGTTLQFDNDIYPELLNVCAACHVPGVADSRGGTISVFSGGADVAFASLVAGGTSCAGTTLHKVCVNEPQISVDVARLLIHAGVTSTQARLLPAGYSDSWMQKFLHWIAAGAHRTNVLPDAGFDAPPGAPDAPIVLPPDAPLPLPDAPLPPPDAPPPPDATVHPPDARVIPDGKLPPGPVTILTPTAGSTTGPKQIPVTWNPAAPNGSPITQYVVTAIAGGVTAATVTCNAPAFTDPNCGINAGQTILNAKLIVPASCTAYDVTVTAFSAGGSTTSQVNSVTPLAPPGVPGSPTLTASGASGELVYSWQASVHEASCGTVTYSVVVTPPSGFTCNPIGCSNDMTGTSFDSPTTWPSCPYGSVDCSVSLPLSWSFQVRASNSGGTSALTAASFGTPKTGYARDQVASIWHNTALGGDGQACINCHPSSSVSPPLCDNQNYIELDDVFCSSRTSLLSTTDGTGAIVNADFPNSAIHVCPTATTVSGYHAGGHRYDSGSKEDTLVQRWVADGTLP